MVNQPLPAMYRAKPCFSDEPTVAPGWLPEGGLEPIDTRFDRLRIAFGGGDTTDPNRRYVGDPCQVDHDAALVSRRSSRVVNIS